MSAALKSATTALTNLDVPTTYKIKFGDNQYHFFGSWEQRFAVETARQVQKEYPNAKLYSEDGTGIHLMSLTRLPEKSGSQKRREKLSRSVTNVDELFVPPLTKNAKPTRRKAVRKALATA